MLCNSCTTLRGSISPREGPLLILSSSLVAGMLRRKACAVLSRWHLIQGGKFARMMDNQCHWEQPERLWSSFKFIYPLIFRLIVCSKFCVRLGREKKIFKNIIDFRGQFYIEQDLRTRGHRYWSLSVGPFENITALIVTFSAGSSHMVARHINQSSDTFGRKPMQSACPRNTSWTAAAAARSW